MLKGFKVDGHSFIGDAIKKGAKTLIVQEDVSVQEDITIIKVRDTRKALAIMSSNYFGNPKDKLKIIGIKELMVKPLLLLLLNLS